MILKNDNFLFIISMKIIIILVFLIQFSYTKFKRLNELFF